MKFLEAFDILDTRDNIGIKRAKDEIGFIVKKNNRYKVILNSNNPDHFLNDMDYCFNSKDKDADDWIVIDTNTLKEIKYYTSREQLKFINETIQSLCMEKEGNLIYFYIQKVATKFVNASDIGRMQLSNIVYDMNLHQTIKSRYYNLTDVYLYFDFMNKQFYRLEK